MVGQFADLLASIPPGTVTVAVRHPIFGSSYLDPFGPGPSPISAMIQTLGFSVNVYPGPPRPEDTDAPSLTNNLAVLGLVAGGTIAWLLLRKRG